MWWTKFNQAKWFWFSYWYSRLSDCSKKISQLYLPLALLSRRRKQIEIFWFYSRRSWIVSWKAKWKEWRKLARIPWQRSSHRKAKTWREILSIQAATNNFISYSREVPKSHNARHHRRITKNWKRESYQERWLYVWCNCQNTWLEVSFMLGKEPSKRW